MRNFSGDSPWQDWVDMCREIDSERPDFEQDESKCSLVVWARSLGDITLAEAVYGPCVSDQGASAWAWAITVAGDRIPQNLRGGVIDAICFSPPMAAITYQRMQAFLTYDENLTLWNSFEGNMPVTREKLARLIGVPTDG